MCTLSHNGHRKGEPDEDTIFHSSGQPGTEALPISSKAAKLNSVALKVLQTPVCRLDPVPLYPSLRWTVLTVLPGIICKVPPVALNSHAGDGLLGFTTPTGFSPRFPVASMTREAPGKMISAICAEEIFAGCSGAHFGDHWHRWIRWFSSFLALGPTF